MFKACDVVCVPSRNEPFGIIVLEAWAASKPVVASQNGGPGEFVWHNVNGLKVYPTVDSVGWGLGTVFTNFEWPSAKAAMNCLPPMMAPLTQVF